MAKSKATFNKRDKEKKRLQKREEKQLKKEERKANAGTSSFESMIAYVDENGQLTSTPPDPTKRVEIDAESIELGVPRRLESDEVPAERIGKVDFFDSTKGFGFIKEDGTQERFFVHVSGLQEEIKEGEKVGFEVERGLKGMNAVRVHKV
jgi:cold shock CspA family protein